MSEAALRTALQTQLAAVVPTLPIALENVSFVPPTPSLPYLVAILMFANPENREMGKGHFLLGYMQVNVCYPLGSGTAAASAQAEAIKAGFPKAATYVSGPVTVQVDGIVAIKNGLPAGSVWSLPVQVPFKAWIN